ncbi:hypothetical protein [Agrobacterium rosae]|uniref:Uncharacterized protein n=1 Tax=Agrobacterium rosae TaxID=1972867 RepID=A0AAE5VML6_9HYPH|nr:hypothetical protein [Agrobacterium rosae]KAA3511619.1 hypothetical protein DXM21_14340 [Agrobacterium rosae]KAA3518957.1 hypothetical protein DXM25_13675 [Agrobacterium rosae]MQB49316.1 hypothetical protein [Agrobacterium rosae]POO49157.1 hypothetical protein CPJ18_22165 [Agrobacterium rosae]
MADIFDRVEDALANKVELYRSGELWDVRITEEGLLTLFSFPEMDIAVDHAEAERKRLGLSEITFL